MAFTAAQTQVATTIKELNDCTDSVKQLLLTALPNAFGPDLHPYQQEAASMLRKSLEGARAAAGEAQVGTSQRAKEAQTVLEALQADAESTAGAEEDARGVLNEKVSALEAAQEDVKTEEGLCKEAKANMAVVAEERQKLEAAKAEAESVHNGSFRMLLDGGWEDEEVRDACIEGVCSYLSNAGVDAVLMAALPKALKLRPAECGGFDKMAVDEGLRLISNKVAACTAKLAEGEEQFEDANAEYMGACAILDLAREKVQTASQARDEADAAVQAAVVDQKLARSKVMDQDNTLATMLSEATLADAKVEQIELALSNLAKLEAGIQDEKENQENKENVMEVDTDSKAKAMDIDHLPVAITA